MNKKISALEKEAREKIGDGKMPNLYFVFHADEKFELIKDKEGVVLQEMIAPEEKHSGGCLGVFDTYKEALQAADKAYYPHVTIEDRITGELLDTSCIVCSECGNETYETREDISLTKKHLEANGIVFQ